MWKGKVDHVECPKCGRISYNKTDIKNKYCGACHEFHDLRSEVEDQRSNIEDQRSKRSRIFSRGWFISQKIRKVYSWVETILHNVWF